MFQILEQKSTPRHCTQQKCPQRQQTNSANKDAVHIDYIGYNSAIDEWRPRDDIVYFISPWPSVSEEFCLYKELALRVKSSLVSQKRSNPAVIIEMSFDKDVYEGLSAAGYVKCTKKGIKHCTIRIYNDLNGLLGAHWHYRGLNSGGDFCYVIKDTIDFYLYKRRPLILYSTFLIKMGIQLKFLFQEAMH